MADVMITGLGSSGGWALEFLARTPDVSEIVVCDAKDRSKHIATALSGANHLGFYPRVRFEQVDLTDVERTATIIEATKPAVILNCTALMPWYSRKLLDLPPDMATLLKHTGVAAWLPMHVCIIQRVMMAVHQAGVDSRVINLCFPDAVNAILARQGLAPALGAGNADLLIPNLQRAVAARLGGHEREVEVLLVAHHSLTGMGPSDTQETIPYYLKVLHRGRDVTEELPVDQMMYQAGQDRLPGAQLDSLAASSMVKNALAILRDSHLRTFAPGPAGLVGGYPVEVARDSVEVRLPADLTMDQAVALNEHSQQRDGISEIAADGTVNLTEKAWQSMYDLSGYRMPSFRPDESYRRAMELIDVYRGLKAKYGVKQDVPQA